MCSINVAEIFTGRARDYVFREKCLYEDFICFICNESLTVKFYSIVFILIEGVAVAGIYRIFVLEYCVKDYLN